MASMVVRKYSASGQIGQPLIFDAPGGLVRHVSLYRDTTAGTQAVDLWMEVKANSTPINYAVQVYETDEQMDDKGEFLAAAQSGENVRFLYNVKAVTGAAAKA